MTYRLDSDIIWYYGQTLNLATGHKIAPGFDIQWRQPEDDFEGEHVIKKSCNF